MSPRPARRCECELVGVDACPVCGPAARASAVLRHIDRYHFGTPGSATPIMCEVDGVECPLLVDAAAAAR